MGKFNFKKKKNTKMKTVFTGKGYLNTKMLKME